ncbi:MAG: porin [Proteobacteria bacterium]|nr:porin [Pseudomonadota bacterium]
MKSIFSLGSILGLAMLVALPVTVRAEKAQKAPEAPKATQEVQKAPEPLPTPEPAKAPEPAKPSEGGVSVGIGDLKISGIFQGVYKLSIVSNNNTNSFNMKRARIFLIGSIVPDKVKYVFQGDAVNDGSLSGNLTDGYKYTSNPWLLDARLIFVTPIPNTEIQVGRFLPNFTYYMPQLVSKLDLIEYPLLTSTFAMWRQVGLQTTTKFSKGSFNFGILNSSGLVNSTEAPHYQNTWGDADNWKSFLVRGNLKPSDNVETAVYLVTGRELSAAVDNASGAAEYWTTLKAGGFLRVSGSGLTALLEGIFAKEGKYKGYALLAQAGYKPSDKVEALVRLDAVDKCMINDSRQIRPTVGINYYISGTNAAIYVDYFLDIYEASGSKKPSTVEVQAQVAF